MFQYKFRIQKERRDDKKLFLSPTDAMNSTPLFESTLAFSDLKYGTRTQLCQLGKARGARGG